MSLQSSHSQKKRKTMQPRQIAKNASSEAATTSSPINT